MRYSALTCPPGCPQRVFALLERGERVGAGVQVGAEVVLRPPAGGFDGCGNHGMGSVVAGQGGWLEADIIKLVAATVATEDVRCQYHKASLIGTPVTPPLLVTPPGTRGWAKEAFTVE